MPAGKGNETPPASLKESYQQGMTVVDSVSVVFRSL